MKFSALVFLAVASSVSGDKSPGLIARWCCVDSDHTCADACAAYAAMSDAELIADGVVDAIGRANPYNPEEDVANPTENFLTDEEGDFVDKTEVAGLCATDATPFHCCSAAYVCGDPHFSTWGGETYDYQGECDLKFLQAPQYAKGLGLNIHIRTKVRYDYSFIESAAIKIGDNVLEVAGYGQHKFNGVEGADLVSMGHDIPVSHEMINKKSHQYTIDAGAVSENLRAKIVIKTFKDWVSIHIEEAQGSDFDGSEGLLGSFPRGQRFGRDGITIIADDNEFGQEWQVLPAEQGLFDTVRSPQMPEQCVLPKTTEAEVQRRLAESSVTEEQAKAACANVPSHQEFCVRDVLATGDLDLADADAYVY